METTKADLRKLGEGYHAKVRADALKSQISKAVEGILNNATQERTSSKHNLYIYLDDTEFCNDFLAAIKSYFPDIDVSIGLIDEYKSIPYEFSWKD